MNHHKTIWITVEAGSKNDAKAVARNQGYKVISAERMNGQRYDVEVGAKQIETR